MGIEIPDELQWVAKWILGAGDWPEGDETAMRRVADAWTSMAQPRTAAELASWKPNWDSAFERAFADLGLDPQKV
ncbi:hypothetical protein ACWDNR_25995, partial [Gordonia aichiensis]